MDSFQIFEDKDENKENDRVVVPAKAKNTKQPLGVLNANKLNQKKPAQEEYAFREAKIRKTDNLTFEDTKSKDLLPVVKHFNEEERVALGEHQKAELLNCDAEQNVEESHDKLIQTKDTAKSFANKEFPYQNEILDTCREIELKRRPKALYMLHQMEICHRMRSILIDWLVTVTQDYPLQTETLHLSVSYLDRILSKVTVQRNHLQLVGMTALYIASKYEEVCRLRVSDLIRYTAGSYTREELMHVELWMLKTLSFELVTPTAYAFIKMYSVICDDMSTFLTYLAQYISELSLLKGDPFLQYLPSQISSGALALARHILGMEMWSPQLEEITTYKLKDLKTVVLALSSNYKSAPGFSVRAIQLKYSGDHYKNVARIAPTKLTKEKFDRVCLTYDAKHNRSI